MDNILTKIATILDTDYQEKYVDDEFLQAIFNDVVELQGTRKYVENGLSTNEEEPMLFSSAGYDKKAKKIKFFDTSLIYAKYEVNVYIKGLSESKRVFATNLLLVTTLLHELEHVNQEKLKENSDLYEAELLRAEDGNNENTSTYDLMPSERFAESKALSSALTILSRSTLIVPELYSYLEEKRNLCLIKGYEDTYNECQSYPIKQYMDKNNISHSPMSISESLYTEPELETRLFYGMPITEDEYKSTRTKAGLKNDSGSYTV